MGIFKSLFYTGWLFLSIFDIGAVIYLGLTDSLYEHVLLYTLSFIVGANELSGFIYWIQSPVQPTHISWTANMIQGLCLNSFIVIYIPFITRMYPINRSLIVVNTIFFVAQLATFYISIRNKRIECSSELDSINRDSIDRDCTFNNVITPIAIKTRSRKRLV